MGTRPPSTASFKNVTLPPISKVFPEHFGLQPAPSMTFKPSNASGQTAGYPQLPQPSFPVPQQAGQRNFQFANAPAGPGGLMPLKQVIYQQNNQQQIPPSAPGFRNNSLNYYQNAFKAQSDFRAAVYNQQPQQPAGYPHQFDRKRSYHQQGPSAELASSSAAMAPLKTARSSLSNSSSMARNLIDNPSQGASTIQVKLNFRNFAIQLSSKSTNLTSNQSGTAAADKEHFASVMQDSVIACSVDFINAFPDYRPTVNNKLKPLKFMEFLQEQLYINYNNQGTGFSGIIPPKDDLVYFYRLPDHLAAKRPDLPRYRIFRNSRTLGIAIYRKGQRIFPVTPEDIADFWLETPRNQPVQSKECALTDLRDDDLVMICRGYVDNLESEADSLAEDASKVPPGGDLDDILPPSGHVLDDLRGETATILAILGAEFDEYMLQGTKYRIRHVIHVEKSGHTAIDEPWPYAITKHTLVVRPYLAMLYSDASKINRFSPTIEFILKKAKAAPIGESILKFLGKLSEIQHMAAGMIIGDKLRYWATGGAFIVHLHRQDPKSSEWQISFPGLTSWSARDFPIISIGEMTVQDGDCLLLCCPEIRLNWTKDEIVSVIKSRALWPEKFQILTNRLKEEKNSKNGLGFYEITLPQ